jgi:hypothetical protein
VEASPLGRLTAERGWVISTQVNLPAAGAVQPGEAILSAVREPGFGAGCCAEPAVMGGTLAASFSAAAAGN